MTVGEVVAKMELDDSPYKKGLSRAEGMAKTQGSKIGSIFKNAFSVTIGIGMFEALKKGFKETVGTAISFNAMLQTAQIGFTTMLGSAEKAQKFLDDMADFAAKTPFEYPDLLDATKRMLAYGFAADDVFPMLRAVGDATAALGMGSEGVNRIILALGQMRAKGKLSAEEMRQLTEAGIPAWEMLADAMGKTTAEIMDMQQKGLIPADKAIQMMTAGMNKRFGGMMANMENTWVGVTSTIKDIWRMTVGTLTQDLFGGLNAMLIKVRDFLQQFYSMLQSVMGKKAKKATDELADSTEDQADAMSDVGDSAEEAAKKANENLQAFDEVHQLQEDMSDTASGDLFGTTGMESPITPLETEEAGEPEAFKKMEEILERLKVLFDPVVEGFNRLKEAVGPVIKNIGDNLKWFYENVLVPFGTWVISEAIPAFFDLLSETLNVINPILDAFKPLGQWLWDSFLQPIAAWTGQAFIDSINLVSDALKNIGDWMSENKDIVEGTTKTIVAFFAAWKITQLMAFIQTSGGVVAALKAITAALFGSTVAKMADKAETIALTALYAKDFIVSLATAVASLVTSTAAWVANTAAKAANTVAAWAAVAGQTALTVATTAWSVICGAATVGTTALGAAFNFLMAPITLVILAIGAVIAIVVLLIKHWDEVSAAAEAAWEWIKRTWQVVAGWFNSNVIQPVAKFFASLRDGIKKAASDTWNWIKRTWQVVSGWFDTHIIKPVGKLFANLWSGIKGIWNRVSGWFKSHVVQPLVRIFNGLKTKITGIWDGIKSVVNWVPRIGGKSFGINIPAIPKLAAGTNYIPQDMLAYLHEGETVVPKKYNDEGSISSETIAQAVYRAIIDAFRITQASSGQSGNDRDLVLKIDNTVLARMQLPAIIKEGQRQGLNLVVQGV